MHQRSAVCLFTVLIIFHSAGCGSSRNPVAKVEVVDGVTHVHNPAAPHFPEKTVSFSEELTLGGEETDGENGLYNPVRFAVSKSGSLFVADAGQWRIKEFSSSGEFVRAIGSKGEGPGEFQHITALDFLPDGRLLVMDVRSRRISLFSRKGEFLESFPALARHVFLFWTSASSFLSDEYVWGTDRLTDRRVLVKEYDLTGAEVRSFGEFFMQKFFILREGEETVGAGIPHSPQSVFAADRMQKWLYHMKNDAYVIEVYDREGTLFRKIDRPYNPMPLTASEAEAFRTDPRDPRPLFQRMLREMPLPEYKTVTQLMCVDDRGYLWIQMFEERQDSGRPQTAYDIFDRDGFYDARVWLDSSLELTSAVFAGGKVYMLKEEESGFRSLKRFQVRWNTR